MFKIPVLSEISLLRLGQLSMALEIHERRRFQVRRDPNQLLDLLNTAVDSLNDTVLQRLGDFVASLSEDDHHQLILSGARLHTYRGVQHDGQKAEVPATGHLSKTYRGVALDTHSVPAESSPAADPRFAMTYRGRKVEH